MCTIARVIPHNTRVCAHIACKNVKNGQNTIQNINVCFKELKPRRVKIDLIPEFGYITRKQSKANVLHNNISLGLVGVGRMERDRV